MRGVPDQARESLARLRGAEHEQQARLLQQERSRGARLQGRVAELEAALSAERAGAAQRLSSMEGALRAASEQLAARAAAAEAAHQNLREDLLGTLGRGVAAARESSCQQEEGSRTAGVAAFAEQLLRDAAGALAALRAGRERARAEASQAAGQAEALRMEVASLRAEQAALQASLAAAQRSSRENASRMETQLAAASADLDSRKAALAHSQVQGNSSRRRSPFRMHPKLC